MRTSKFVNLDPNVLLEWIYDNDNLLFEDYNIVVNTISGQHNFINTDRTNTIKSKTNNIQQYNMFEVNAETDRWAQIDNTNYPFLQTQEFSGNVPVRYDIIRVHFPVSYTFDDKLGYLLDVSVLDVSGKIRYYLSDYFFDKTDINRQLELTAPPFLYRDVLWGKFIEIQVPSASVLSKQVTQADGNLTTTTVPTPGTINSNLAGLNAFGVGQNSPIFINFHFLLRKDTLFGKTTYLLQTPFTTSVTQIPEFEDLSVNVAPADDGDFFVINGTYNGTNSEFETFIEQQSSIGNTLYVTYTVNVIEKNIITDTVQYFVDTNFDKPIKFRPIITFSTTTAALDVEMRLVNATDGNFIVRSATYSLLQNEVAKYSRNLTKIDLDSAFKPKIYNATPAQLNIQDVNQKNTQLEKVEVPFPVMFDRFSVVAKNVTKEIEDETYYAIGQLQILLYPFDNIIKLVIAKDIKTDGIKQYTIPTGARITMTFKSNTDTVDSELYFDSGEINLETGNLVFRILQSQISTITTFYKTGYDQFYIVMRNALNVDTIIYAGRFIIFNEF